MLKNPESVFFLSFPRRRESRKSLILLSADLLASRFRGSDEPFSITC
jgi:hypothetical protein